MVMAELSIVPIGEGASVSGFVAEILRLIDGSGLEYRLTPMGTIIEGRAEQVFDLAEACLAKGADLADRVSLSLKIDYRRGDHSRLRHKIAAVEEILGRTLKTMA
jgi:uncharacterized protein (TIGR00106 family)